MAASNTRMKTDNCVNLEGVFRSSLWFGLNCIAFSHFCVIRDMLQTKHKLI